MVWPELDWPEGFTVAAAIKYGSFPPDLIDAAKKVASKEFYRGKSCRDFSKILAHGSNYLGKPRQMSIHSHIPVKIVEHFQEAYFDAFPELPMWHGWVAEQVQTVGEITTMLGRSRRFFGRPNDDATIREAVAFEPQSVAADYTNQALLRIYKASKKGLPIKLFLQKHDEIGFRFLEKDEEYVCKVVQGLMEKEIDLISPEGKERKWVVPTEFETGWNLGFYNKKKNINPNGLSHPDPDRKRIIPPKKHWTDFTF